MQLLTPDIKDNFSAKITRINLAIVPESPQLPKMWELTGISIPPCRSYSCLSLLVGVLVALSSGHSHDFVLHYIWVKTSWVLNLVFCLSVTRSFSKLPSGLSSCLPGVFRQEQAPGWQRWTCVFAMK